MIHNLRTASAAAKAAVYVGRPGRWGNPFIMQHEGQRELVIAQYRAWLWEEIQSGQVGLHELAALHQRDLSCWCVPKACHADVLERAAAWAAAEIEKEQHTTHTGGVTPPHT